MDLTIQDLVDLLICDNIEEYEVWHFDTNTTETFKYVDELIEKYGDETVLSFEVGKNYEIIFNI